MGDDQRWYSNAEGLAGANDSSASGIALQSSPSSATPSLALHQCSGFHSDRLATVGRTTSGCGCPGVR